MEHMRARSGLTLAILFGLTAAVPGQQPDLAAPHFSSQSQLVVLHVVVTDRKGYVGGLEKESFRISENRQPQSVSVFHNQEAPVTVGLLVDSSGSMSPNRRMVMAACLAFAQTMNPQDEIFALGFNEQIQAALPASAPFTSDVDTLRPALLDAIRARGRTAIYNAVNAGLEYVSRGTSGRQALVIVSDGGDNASATTRERVLANAQASNAVIYTVALVDPIDREADPGFLSQLSRATGGEAFRPSRVDDVETILRRIARDIRNMYTLGYMPANPVPSNRDQLRQVSVEVRTPSGQKLKARTRRAYLPASIPERAHDAH
jgi:Ca-activated chloride channel family protein